MHHNIFYFVGAVVALVAGFAFLVYWKMFRKGQIISSQIPFAVGIILILLGVLGLGLDFGYVDYVGKPLISSKIKQGEYPVKHFWIDKEVTPNYVYIAMKKSSEDEEIRIRAFDKRAFDRVDKNANILSVQFKEETGLNVRGTEIQLKKLRLVYVPIK